MDAIDLDTEAVGHHVRQAGGGVNFRPTSESVIKLELVRAVALRLEEIGKSPVIETRETLLGEFER